MCKFSAANKLRTVLFGCLGVLVVSTSAAAQTGRTPTASAAPTRAQQEMHCPIPQNYNNADNTAEYQQLMTAVLSSNPIVSAKYSTHKLRVLRAVSEGNPDEAEQATSNIGSSGSQPPTKPPVSVTVFDYTINKTLFFIVDGNNCKVLRAHTLYGRPQPSQEEIAAASNIVKADPTLASYLGQNARITGGFIVDGPAKAPADHRYMQLRIVTPDLRATKKVVVVDLSTDTVVSK